MSIVLYNIFLRLYHLIAFLISPFHPKARKWIEGRKGVIKKIKQLAKNQKIIWMHCASMGEFEQGRPVMEAIKKKYPDYRMVITFFSPSGYETVKKKLAIGSRQSAGKNTEDVEDVFYLPHDSKKNANDFLDALQPHLAIFVKYELWYYYLTALKQRGTSAILISALFRKEDVFFRWYGSLFREMLGCFTHIFVQNKESEKLLREISIPDVTVSGDTRFDRVMKIKESREIPWVKSFAENSKVLVAGSTWAGDETHLVKLTKESLPLKFIIVPHDIDPQKINSLKSSMNNSIAFSETENEGPKDYNTLIINNTGMLAHLYKYGDVAYVGGGFTKGIHNILEAVVNGMPVIFGPDYKKFNEANELVKLNGAFSVNNYEELKSKVFEFIGNKELYAQTSEICENYVKQNTGATKVIMNYMEKQLIANHQ